MRVLLAVILLATLGWSGYWYMASSGVQAGLARWLDERRAEGWVAETSEITVQGYPNRIDTTLSDIELADPATGLAWSAKFLQILALSYRPNHVIAIWPPAQQLATPYDRFELASTDMRASLILMPNSELTLERLTLTADDLAITREDANHSAELTRLTLAAERVAVDPEPNYRLGLAADGFAPALRWRTQIDPRGTLPETLDALTVDMTVTFDAPWDRFAIERARPQPRKIKLRLAEARWGQLELLVAGDLSVDEAGMPTGRLTVKARNWRDILDLGVASGAVPEGLAGSLRDGLGLLSQLAGNPNTLDLPLEFARGRVFLGPVPIGPAPVLRLR
ncbi:DUF2125 domain-containing protein [Roseovarius faecimaris]|uniref:DUF2125 domain-containing protein n=1 Tax=Roseovarius faecimaris TaxID=2494550 RepID=A0A6I6IQ86_9RHOB|nr:DUF2125 domain-containing protein [Roseovarius faecimaris]QGX97376.1 DUF2125 domain-containing protein [Roseovarius faecimaris]